MARGVPCTREQIEQACSMLEDPLYTYSVIYDKTGVQKSTLSQIVNGRLYQDIASKYDIDTIQNRCKIHENRGNDSIRLSDTVVNGICKMLQNPLISYDEIRDKYGVRKSTIVNIFKRVEYTDISDDYIFPPKRCPIKLYNRDPGDRISAKTGIIMSLMDQGYNDEEILKELEDNVHEHLGSILWNSILYVREHYYSENNAIKENKDDKKKRTPFDPYEWMKENLSSGSLTLNDSIKDYKTTLSVDIPNKKNSIVDSMIEALMELTYNRISMTMDVVNSIISMKQSSINKIADKSTRNLFKEMYKKYSNTDKKASLEEIMELYKSNIESTTFGYATFMVDSAIRKLRNSMNLELTFDELKHEFESYFDKLPKELIDQINKDFNNILIKSGDNL